MNLGNAVDACCIDNDAASLLVDALRDEGEAVLAAADVEVIAEPDDRVRRGDLLRRGETPAPPGSSTWQSLARGTGSVETDYLNGEIVMIARRLGVPAPLNERVQRLAASMAADGRPPRSVDARTLLPD
jgi:2-dehydropantoate 2-reductase